MDPTDPKLIQVLVDNQLGKLRDGDISLAFGFQWVPAPEGSQCPHCKGALERTTSLMLSSSFTGSVRCTACTYKDTVCGYLGRSMIQVEPMPPGAVPFYDGDPDVIDTTLSDEPATGTTRWHPACVHVGNGCDCECHSAPILHVVACCSPCPRCGFRTVESP